MEQFDPQYDAPAPKRAWTAPELTTLDVSRTAAGPSPNIQETVLTDASLLSS